MGSYCLYLRDQVVHPSWCTMVSTIIRVCRNSGPQWVAMHPKFTKFKAIVHYQSFHATLREVASQYGVGKSSVHRWVRQDPGMQETCEGLSSRGLETRIYNLETLRGGGKKSRIENLESRISRPFRNMLSIKACMPQRKSKCKGLS